MRSERQKAFIIAKVERRAYEDIRKLFYSNYKNTFSLCEGIEKIITDAENKKKEVEES